METTQTEERVLDYFNYIYFTALKRCSNPHLAQDYAQETAERLLRLADSDLGLNYINLTINSVIVSDWRKADRKPILVEEVPETISHKLEQDYETKETLKEVRNLATQEEWTYITMFSEGYSIPEIASQFGISRQRVERKLASIRKKAKKL